MSYEKQDFTDNTVLTAAQLNHMEEGIAAAEELAGKAGTDLTIGTVTTGDRAAASIEDGKLNLTLPRGEKGDSGTAASALTPEQFGAVGDGVANDTEAILAAAQAACEQGKHLSFSAGKTYLWSNGADFAALNGLYIEGNGAKVFAKDRVLLFRQMTNTTVEGLHFIASPSSAAMELIKIFECTGFKLLDCTLEWDLHDNIDSEHNILDVYRGNRDVLIRGCTLKQLTGTRAGGIWIREGKAGFIGQNIRIENCDIYKAGGDEVLAVWGWAGHLRDVTMDGKLIWSAAMGESGSSSVTAPDGVDYIIVKQRETAYKDVRIARGCTGTTTIRQADSSNGSGAVDAYATVTFASNGKISYSYPSYYAFSSFTVEGYQYI